MVESLNDEIMTAYEWSLESNRDLASARSKVTEARAALGINKSSAFAMARQYRLLVQLEDSCSDRVKGKGVDIYRLGIDASWEIDIFGGRRETVKAGAASLEAQYASLLPPGSPPFRGRTELSDAPNSSGEAS